MFNYESIDKTPTVSQVKSMIKHMEDEPTITYNFSHMMKMKRLEPNKIQLDLNNAHFGTIYEIVFTDDGIIASFSEKGTWIS